MRLQPGDLAKVGRYDDYGQVNILYLTKFPEKDDDPWMPDKKLSVEQCAFVMEVYGPDKHRRWWCKVLTPDGVVGWCWEPWLVKA